MVYDRDCPQWLKTDWEAPSGRVPKPVVKRKYNRSSRKDRYNSKSVTQNGSRNKIMKSEVGISEQ